METTDGTLLGGRVRYTQPVGGYRTGIEPVLLAAAIPARPGQRVLEGGTGAGAALLCLAARVPGLVGQGIERDPGMAALARRNMAANAAPFGIATADLLAGATAGATGGAGAGAAALAPVEHAFANPPWHAPTASRPPDPVRAAATHRAPEGIEPWIDALAAVATETVSLVLPAALTGAALARLHGLRWGRAVLFPLWPRAGQAAKLALLQARPGLGPTTLAAGLVLHGAGSGYGVEADSILRHGAALVLAGAPLRGSRQPPKGPGPGPACGGAA